MAPSDDDKAAMSDSGSPDHGAEVREWREAISSIIAFEGVDRADEVLTEAVDTARRHGAKLPFSANTAYINTISPHEEPPLPGNRDLEHAIKSAIRW
ncbi:MAG: pyruvate dehydrogenase (acetyl-transferring), homodimeric type, partial [Hyphomicrobium sp.]